MRILHLTLKKKWFDMIASGEKKEEYREQKGYWMNRLMERSSPWTYGNFKEFDAIQFKNGYQPYSPVMLVECKGIFIQYGRPEWGAPENSKVFVISLGKIINP